MENNNIVVKNEGKTVSQALNSFGNIKSFEDTQRMAVALAKSSIVPKEYQNNVGNCIIALDIADRVGLSPMMVMQNLYVVNGRPSWGSQSIAAMINNSRKFAAPLKYVLEGKGESLSCYVEAKDHEGNVITGPTITMAMAKEEGWTSKSGSKWKTMPEIMIRYRAASFFGRLYCSDLLMGIYSEDENKDMGKDFETTKVDVEKEVEEIIQEPVEEMSFDDVEFEEVKS